MNFLKIGYSENMENHLYKTYLKNTIDTQISKYNLPF